MDLNNNKNNLICHPSTERGVVESVVATLKLLADGGLRVRYELTGDLARLRIPAPQAPGAADGLWEHTCFEAFIAADGEPGYHEFNFSPSGQWAAYAFGDYRARGVWAISRPPLIRVSQDPGHLRLEAVIAAADLPPNRVGKPFRLGLTAVIEANDGSLAYWALHHPEARPDFHHRAGFISSFTPARPLEL